MANRAAIAGDCDLSRSQCEEALGLINRLNGRLADPDTKGLVHDLRVELAGRYLLLGDVLADQEKIESAMNSYQQVHAVLADFKVEQKRPLWNEAIRRQIAPIKTRLASGQPDEVVSRNAKEMLVLLSNWIGPQDAGDRALAVESLVQANQRLANSAYESQDFARAALFYLEVLERLKKDENQYRTTAVDGVGRSVELEVWEHNQRFRVVTLSDDGHPKDAVLTRWLTHCDEIISQLKVADANVSDRDALIREIEILLKNSVVMWAEINGARKRIGLRRIRFMIAVNSNPSSVAEEAAVLLTSFGLRTTGRHPKLTFEIWQLVLPSLIQHKKDFLTGDRVFGLIDLIEKHVSSKSEENLKQFRCSVYRELPCYDSYEGCQYEIHHAPLLGGILNSSPPPLDYFYCLELAADMVQKPESAVRVRELCRICAKRFENHTESSERLESFEKRYFTLVDHVVPCDERRILLELVSNNALPDTRMESYKRLRRIAEDKAADCAKDGRFEDAIAEYELALTRLASVESEYVFSNPASTWEARKIKILDHLISVCRQASDANRKLDVGRTNAFLFDALRFLQQSCQLSGKKRDHERIAILERIILQEGRDALRGFQDARFAFERAVAELRADRDKAEWVEHFLRLAFLGGALDEAAFNYHLAKCHLQDSHPGDARACFENTIRLTADRNENDSSFIKARCWHGLASIALTEADAANDADEELGKRRQAIEDLRKAISVKGVPVEWFDQLITALRRTAKLASDGPAANKDLVEALRILATRKQPVSDKSGLEQTREEILQELSRDHVEGITLGAADASFCIECARRHIKKGSEFAVIDHLLQLARHGGAVNEPEFLFESGRAQLAGQNGDREKARLFFTSVLEFNTEAGNRLLSKAHQRIGEIDLKIAISQSSTGQENMLNLAIESFHNARRLDMNATVDDQLGACYEGLYKIEQTATAESPRSIRETVVNGNDNLRRAFQHYDRFHNATSDSGRAEALKKIKRTGGAIGYLMLAALESKTDQIVQHLTRCNDVFPDTGAAKLAWMIRTGKYPDKFAGVANKSDHDLPSAHFKLATAYSERELVPAAEFLLLEASKWSDEKPSSDVRKPDIDATLRAVRERINSIDDNQGARTQNGGNEPSAIDMGWQRVGTAEGMIHENLDAAMDLLTQAEPVVPPHMRLAIKAVNAVIKNYGDTTSEEKASADANVGLEMIKQFFPAAHAVTDETILAIANGVTKAAAKKENISLTFYIYVEELGQMNAFALPGGYIVLSKELIEECRNKQDELAFVIGHEAAHILKKHYVNRFLLGNAKKLIGSYDRAGVIRWLSAAYSKDQEFQADELGVRYAHAANYKADGGINLLNRLRNNKEESGSISSYLYSSHPPCTDRIVRIRDTISKLPRD